MEINHQDITNRINRGRKRNPSVEFSKHLTFSKYLLAFKFSYWLLRQKTQPYFVI